MIGYLALENASDGGATPDLEDSFAGETVRPRVCVVHALVPELVAGSGVREQLLELCTVGLRNFSPDFLDRLFGDVQNWRRFRQTTVCLSFLNVLDAALHQAHESRWRLDQDRLDPTNHSPVSVSAPTATEDHRVSTGF